MPTEVILPRVDMDMASGRISRWFVVENARVEKGQPLFEIETDKAAMDVEAPASGILQGIVDAQGGDLPVGSTVGWILAEGEAPPQAAAQAGAPPPPSLPEPAPPPPSSQAPGHAETSVRRATPLARRLARERGIELSAVRGSGPRGRVQRVDIEAAQGVAAGVQDAALNAEWLRQGDGRPLVLLHGFGADLNGWRSFLAGAAFDRPVLAFDLPGHGQSALGQSAVFESLAATVEAALLRGGAGAVDLVGHSLGGAVAIRIAAGRHVAVRSLLLLAPAGLGPEINGAFLHGLVNARSEASLYPWMRELVADEAVLSRSLVKAAVVKQSDAGRAAQNQLLGALFPDGTQAFSVRTLIDDVTAPVKLVFGADDRIIPPRHARGLPGKVAVHVFPGVGHMPHLEVTPAVQQLATELLRSAP